MTDENGPSQMQGHVGAAATEGPAISAEVLEKISKLRDVRQRLGESTYRQEWKRLSKDEAKQILNALPLLKGEAERSARVAQQYQGQYNTWRRAFSIFIRFIAGVILASVVFGVIDFYLLTSFNVIGLFLALFVEFIITVGMIIWPIKMTLDAAMTIHDGEAHRDSMKP